MSLKSILLKPVFKFQFNYNIFKPWRWNWQTVKNFLMSLFIGICITLTLFGMYYYVLPVFQEEEPESIGEQIIAYLEDYFSDYSGTDPFSGEACNVAGIEVRGDIVSYIPPTSFDAEGNLLEDQVASDEVVGMIKQAEKDDKIKAILLEIDSYGGEPVASEEISNTIKYATKPTVALIRTAGASGAYLIASGAQRIFASRYSDVGGIGVTSSYLDNVKKNQQDGLSYVNLSAGKFKDTGSPDKTLSKEEKNLIMRDINIIHQNFIKKVADNRKLDIKKVAKLADGSTMLGEAALKNGLIDQIGSWYDVREYLKTKLGTDASICWE